LIRESSPPYLGLGGGTGGGSLSLLMLLDALPLAIQLLSLNLVLYM